MNGHFIWCEIYGTSLGNFGILGAFRQAKYQNYPMSFINFILNDHECKILFIT